MKIYKERNDQTTIPINTTKTNKILLYDIVKVERSPRSSVQDLNIGTKYLTETQILTEKKTNLTYGSKMRCQTCMLKTDGRHFNCFCEYKFNQYNKVIDASLYNSHNSALQYGNCEPSKEYTLNLKNTLETKKLRKDNSIKNLNQAGELHLKNRCDDNISVSSHQLSESNNSDLFTNDENVKLEDSIILAKQREALNLDALDYKLSLNHSTSTQINVLNRIEPLKLSTGYMSVRNINNVKTHFMPKHNMVTIDLKSSNQNSIPSGHLKKSTRAYSFYSNNYTNNTKIYETHNNHNENVVDSDTQTEISSFYGENPEIEKNDHQNKNNIKSEPRKSALKRKRSSIRKNVTIAEHNNEKHEVSKWVNKATNGEDNSPYIRHSYTEEPFDNISESTLQRAPVSYFTKQKHDSFTNLHDPTYDSVQPFTIRRDDYIINSGEWQSDAYVQQPVYDSYYIRY